MENPRLITITMPAADTNGQLSTLLADQDVRFADPFLRCRRVSIQADVDGGGTRFFVGNSGLSGTNRGVELVATQAVLYEAESDLIMLTDIYVRANASGQFMNVAVQWA